MEILPSFRSASFWTRGAKRSRSRAWLACRWQTADGRRQTADGRRQTADGRRRTAAAAAAAALEHRADAPCSPWRTCRRSGGGGQAAAAVRAPSRARSTPCHVPVSPAASTPAYLERLRLDRGVGVGHRGGSVGSSHGGWYFGGVGKGRCRLVLCGFGARHGADDREVVGGWVGQSISAACAARSFLQETETAGVRVVDRSVV